MPQWEALIAALAADAELKNDDLAGLDLLDRANVIQAAFTAMTPPVDIGSAVSAKFEHGPYSLSHALLANLPVEEFITTNYDQRLEEAAADSGRPVTVLRHKAVADSSRWLLKLHGSVDDPEDIVLTRTDYLDYAQCRAALRGIVQAMLLTRHMLFVGFGLSDDNFHRIAHDVRAAVSQRGGPQDAPAQDFATALRLKQRPLFERLWGGDIGGLAFGPEDGEVAASARRLEVFLDLVLAESTRTAAHFMDPAYEGLLDDDEVELRDQLRKLWDGAPADARERGAWRAFGQLLDELGLPATDSSTQPRQTMATQSDR